MQIMAVMSPARVAGALAGAAAGNVHDGALIARLESIRHSFPLVTCCYVVAIRCYGSHAEFAVPAAYTAFLKGLKRCSSRCLFLASASRTGIRFS